ncbi:MAG: hypothetical protein ACXQS4_03690 [Methermicoccaceae archaeon]
MVAFVEGRDDTHFFNKVLKPLFQEKGWISDTWEYQERGEQYKRTLRYLKSINSMNADYIADYVYFRDINHTPCVTAKKEKIMKKLKRRMNQDKIIIVVKEIESWYLAVDDETLESLGVHENIKNTDDITKEKFDALIPDGVTRKEFMTGLLENYNVETAKKKNTSFKYFMEKWVD